MRPYHQAAIAIAAASAMSGSVAQSNVKIIGLLDASLSHGKGSLASKTQLSNSAYNSSKIGFMGTEDLGGGLSAGFWLEAGIANDTGAGVATNTNNQANGAVPAGGLNFNRRSTVSLSGPFGEMRLGRDYTAHFWNLNTFDPFNTNGVGAVQAYTSTVGSFTTPRASNIVGYFLPANLGGFYGQVQHYFGENTGEGPTRKDGSGDSVRLGYAAGALNVAIGAGNTRYATGDVQIRNVGASYDFGVATLMTQYSSDIVQSSTPVHARGALIGGLIPVGAGLIRMSYSNYRRDSSDQPRTTKVAVGYVHNLSKRTAVYGSLARAKNSGGATFAINEGATGPNRSSRGFDVGLRHSF